MTRRAGAHLVNIADDEWFELQFRPEEAFEKCGITLPTLPSDDVQVSFTAQCGRLNLEQAFNFYRQVILVCRINQIRNPRILDFGGGWGRISRFFLREAKPEDIIIADTMAYAIRCLRETGNPCRIIHNQPRPPILGVTEKLDLIYAYSVFSHLSEEYFLAWVDYLLSILQPGGYLAFTTRGRFFIDHLRRLHKDKDAGNLAGNLKEHVRRLREEMPPPDEINDRYLNGDFQFYPIGGSAELTPDFFGETFIPRGYIERKFGMFLDDFSEDVPYIDQSVVILRKPPTLRRRITAIATSATNYMLGAGIPR
jgi:hypothetical protein